MAAEELRYTGKVEGDDLQLFCNEGKLLVTISHPSKMCSWKGEFTEEDLKSEQNIINSIEELYEALVEVLDGKANTTAKIEFNMDEKVFVCNFQFFKKQVPIRIPVVRQEKNIERMQVHLWNQMSSTTRELEGFKRSLNEHIRFQSESVTEFVNGSVQKMEKCERKIDEQLEKELKKEEAARKEQKKEYEVHKQEVDQRISKQNLEHRQQMEKQIGDAKKEMQEELGKFAKAHNTQMNSFAKELQRSMDSFVERLQKVESLSEIHMALKPATLVSPEFVQTKGKTSFEVSGNKKKATKIKGMEDWEGILAKPRFPTGGKFRYSIRPTTTNIMAGVSLDSTRLSVVLMQPSTWMLCFLDGFLWNSGRQVQQLADVTVVSQLKAGDVIGVQVDMHSLSIEFFINEVPVGAKFTLPLKPEDLTHLVPAFEIGSKASVEFI